MAVLVDAHVHFHSCFQVDVFFDAASRNFAQAVRELGLEEVSACILLLADPHGWDTFDTLWDRCRAENGRWSIQETEEETALVAQWNGNAELYLVRGSQVATREGLEVLALDCMAEFPKHAAFEEVLERALALDAVTVVPWGFGKWLGARGRKVGAAVQDLGGRGLFLGDNGGRLAGTPAPTLIRRGARKGVLNLPGSDPLPFPAQEERVGIAGFVLPGELHRHRPAATFRELMRQMQEQPDTFGRGAGILEFVTSQVRMQIKRRVLREV
jgi:hypothetical protein